MTLVFIVAAAVAIVATAVTVTRRHAVHALLSFIVSLFAVAVIFFALDAPFAAALEVIVYAGAIMVLFLFVVMMLNPGRTAGPRRRLRPAVWLIPALLAALLAAEMVWAVAGGAPAVAGRPSPGPTSPGQVGALLFGRYVLGAELAGLLLLAGLVGAAHLGRRHDAPRHGPARERGGEAGGPTSAGARAAALPDDPGLPPEARA